ncbi:hypothetical protein [Cellulomonas denverensis]|uniref:Uncharacterized protein n=1 Tax=Cellulomonas denverensis TaxID=264297 RepID=A0A7X6KUV8_9CELL|nr:hypothetical protein [Cellulomonas denverensis]NKY22701.1 hypothetical protein [Cellulomonas denverensis]GIG24651.1 hypothetical protein Cde04nite_08950 [Cellulomonas denverensis]
MFVRGADAAGLANWHGLVQSGQQADVTVNVLVGEEYRQRSITRFG